MKRNMLFIFNCHGEQILKQFKQSLEKNFTFNHIFIYEYFPSYPKENLKYFDDNDLSLIKNADVIILQNLRSENSKYFLYPEHILTISKDNIQLIKIPHYTFSGYFLEINIDCINKYNSINEFINNYGYNNDIEENLKKELLHIKELDNLSDIKIYDFIKNNLRKYRLFHGRSYPTYYLFNFIANKICDKLGYKIINELIFSNYVDNYDELIFPKVKEILNLSFDNNFKHNITPEEYIKTCKRLNLKKLCLKKNVIT